MRTLFVALLLGEERGRTLARLVQRSLGGLAELRFPRPEGLHLTLFYAGSCTGEAEARLVREMEQEAARAPWLAPKLVLDRASAFPEPAATAGPRGRERVFWVGCREDAARSGRLEELHERVVACAARAGRDVRAERERPFRPHVTVARPRGGARPERRALEDFYGWSDELAWSPDALHLVLSEPSAGPRVYRSVWEAPLSPEVF